MSRRFVITLYILTSLNLLYAQSDFLKDVKALSPMAAALEKFGETPVDLYYGIPDITIPLYSVKEGSLELPISLKYHASGIKVAEIPSQVGLGWILDAGGAIVRKINSVYDERTGSVKGLLSLNASGLTTNEQVFSTVTNSFTTYPAVYSEETKYWVNWMDTAPDEFVFSFNGRTGKFYFNKDGSYISTDKIKLDYFTQIVNGENEIYKFIITDENGTKYFFDQKEYTSVDQGLDPLDNNLGGTHRYVSAWYISKIQSQDMGSEINFAYVSNLRCIAQSDADEYSILYSGQNCSTSIATQTHRNTSIWTDILSLKSISTTSLDLIIDLGSSSGYCGKYDALRINDKAGSEIKRFQLNYKYSNGVQYGLLLTGIQEKSGASSKPPYSFIYDETPVPYFTYGGPSINSTYAEAGIDHWGYYNGPYTYNSLLPVANANPYQPLLNRSPSLTYAKARTLLQINYPTGGSTTYDYELNDYSFVSNKEVKLSSVKAGGLRIKTITIYDGSNHNNDIIKTYEYTYPYIGSSGVIENEPQYFYSYNAPAVNGHNSYTISLWFSNSIVPIGLGYRRVLEKSSDGGYTEYLFSSDFSYPSSNSSDDISLQMQRDCFTSSSCGAYGLYDHPFLKGYGRYYYMRGLLIDKNIYSAGNFLLSSYHADYSAVEVGAVHSFLEKGYSQGAFGCTNIPLGSGFERLVYIGIGHPRLNTEISSAFNNGIQGLTQTTSYAYNSYNNLPSKTTITTSVGTNKVSVKNYPLDYLAGANSDLGIVYLQNKNMINEIVEEYDLIQNVDGSNQQVTSGFLKHFDPSTGYVTQIDELQNAPITISTYNSSKTNFYNPKAQFSYDAIGNITSITKPNDISKVYLWGYNKQYPIAKIENATYSQVKAILGQSVIDGFNTSPGTDAQLRQSLNVLRTNPTLKGSQVITYTYKPLFGMTSSTDPNGVTTYYEYDIFGRLSVIKDDKSNILKTYTYKYKQ